ncbi:hypothetical protein D3C87_1871070 [compost metagenome]
MRAYVDKVEGSQVELRLGEDEAIKLVLPKRELPKGLKEGDVLRLSFERDAEATEADADANDALREALLKRSQDEPF